MGEERGCKEFRKHVAWYLKGFPAGGELRHRWPSSTRSPASTTLLDELDADAPFPSAELGTPRGRQGAPRKRVVLPEGWLDDTDGRGSHLREDADETTGRLTVAVSRVSRNTPVFTVQDWDSPRIVCFTR